ncbi:unnamed protein product [Adineta ricciae]|uniref:Homeobox domain-containing protein n=1 Tax=Adineta ricciae TaxID=249248 RepID=A0A815ZQR9_ADIRI|nr:unnamed protein product [Adineta ricciae]
MDQPDADHYLSLDLQQNMLLEMMKQHISSGLPYQYPANYLDQNLPQQSDEDTLSHAEHEQDENEQMPMPIVYKKRARVKFTQEQINVLEATFQQHRYPTIDMIDDLVEQLHLPTQKITVWFQNRRARLKKSQQKLEKHQSFEHDEPQHYDSGIHLEEDVSCASSTSPPLNVLPRSPPLPYIPPPPAPYYLPNPHPPFYNSMWQNFHYPIQPSYDFVSYNSPFVFHDISNYSPPAEYHG